MADNWIQSFAVALGFDVNTSSLNIAKNSIADYQRAVEQAEKAIEDARWAGAKTEEEVAALTRTTNLRLAREALEGAKAREKAEQEEARKRKERSAEFIAGLQKAAIAAAAAATAISYAVNKVTGAFDNLYFQAQRSGTSVQSLKALGYGFSQVGGTAQQAGAAVDSFTTKLRNNPGLRQFVKDLGVDDSLQGVDKFTATMDALVKQPKEIGVQYAEMLGVSEETFNLYLRQGEALKQYRAEYDATAKRFGLNSEQAAAASTAFQRSLTRLQATAGVLTDKLMASLAPAIQGLIDRFQKWVNSNPGVLDKILNDIAKAVVAVAEGIGKFLAQIAGDGGDEFLKKWDAFVTRAERFASAVERSVLGIEKLLKMTGLLNREAVPGMGSLVTGYRDWVHRQFGGEGAGPGVGAIGGFDPLQPGGRGTVPDNRTWWERHAPTALGGKPDPNATPDQRGGVFRRAARALRGDHSDGVAANPGAYKDVLDHIARSEGTATQPGGGYNTSLGYGRYLPGGKEQNLTSMTLDQILALGDHMRRQPGNPNSSALGRYQIVGSTLRDQMRKLDLKGSDLFDEKMQDRIAANLARQRGASPAGLRNEWASLVGAKNATAVALMQKVDPKASVMPLDRKPAPGVAQREIGRTTERETHHRTEREVERQAAPVSPDRASASSIHVSSPKIEVTGGSSGSSAAPVINVPGLPRMMQMPDFDPVQLMQPAPSAAYSVINNGGSTSKAVHQTFNTNTTIHEARNVREAGRVMEGTFGRMHGLALANAQSAIA